MRELEALLQREPSVMVGAAATSGLPKARHLLPMLSLFSVSNQEDAIAWHKRILRKLPYEVANAVGQNGSGLNWIVEPKVDGLAVSLLYKDGQLARVSEHSAREKRAESHVEEKDRGALGPTLTFMRPCTPFLRRPPLAAMESRARTSLTTPGPYLASPRTSAGPRPPTFLHCWRSGARFT
jgi:hypothetical protein